MRLQTILSKDFKMRISLYTTECKIVGWWEAAAQHREIGSALCDDLRGGIGRMGGRLKREGIWGHVYAYG